MQIDLSHGQTTEAKNALNWTKSICIDSPSALFVPIEIFIAFDFISFTTNFNFAFSYAHFRA